MNDLQRVYPVDTLIIHHSMGPRFADASDLEIQDWFSSVGKGRAYNNGAINPYHEHPGRPGQLTYAQAQFAGVPDSKNKYGYRIVTLIARPWDNVAWHAGNWPVNQKSIGIENCGDFTNMLLTDKQLMCIADFYRPQDTKLKGATTVLGHKEVSGASTACPARLLEQRDKLVDMINNPAKWNAILWPAPKPPTPVITFKTEVMTPMIPFAKKTIEDPTRHTTGVTTIGVNGKRTVTYQVTYTDGKETKRVIVSNVVTVPPIDEVTTIGTYVEPPVVVPPAVPVEPVKPTIKAPTLFELIISDIIEWLQKLIKGDK